MDNNKQETNTEDLLCDQIKDMPKMERPSGLSGVSDKVMKQFTSNSSDLTPGEFAEQQRELLQERKELISQIQDGDFKEKIETIIGTKKPSEEDKPKTKEELLLEEIKTLNLSIELLADQIEALANKKSFFAKAFESIQKFFRIVFW